MVAREIILAKMAVQEPKKLDASPPLCFLAPCVKPVTVDCYLLNYLMDSKVIIFLCFIHFNEILLPFAQSISCKSSSILLYACLSFRFHYFSSIFI